MLDQLGSLVEKLKDLVGNFDAGGVNGDEAIELCGRFAELERLAAAGRLMTAERVAATEVWRRGGLRSAADWVARSTGCDVERARDALETAGRLGEFPLVAAEIRSGCLSETQAHAIVDAATVRPEVEGRLVEFARSNSLRRLREECRRAKNVDVSAAGEYKKVHTSREYRTWTGRDGAVCGSFRLTAEAGAALNAAVEDRKAEHVKAARRDGRREPFPAYAADALVELVTERRGAPEAGRRTMPKQMMIVHVAYEAIIRGAHADGETCEIRGIGPIPLEVAQSLALDSILRVLVTRGGQPMAVTPGVRTIPVALRRLIEARDQTCVVPVCDVNLGLQVDHRRPFSQLGPTDLENCALLCKRHHDMKTYLGWVLARADDGSWTFRPPDDYRDPEPPDPAVGELVWSDPWAPMHMASSPEGPTPESPTPEWAAQLALAGASGPSP
jgi:hypothetical protein